MRHYPVDKILPIISNYHTTLGKFETEISLVHPRPKNLKNTIIAGQFRFVKSGKSHKSSVARFSKAPESFRARKAIFRSSVSKNGEVYTLETSCMKGTSPHL